MGTKQQKKKKKEQRDGVRGYSCLDIVWETVSVFEDPCYNQCWLLTEYFSECTMYYWQGPGFWLILCCETCLPVTLRAEIAWSHFSQMMCRYLLGLNYNILRIIRLPIFLCETGFLNLSLFFFSCSVAFNLTASTPKSIHLEHHGAIQNLSLKPRAIITVWVKISMPFYF